MSAMDLQLSDSGATIPAPPFPGMLKRILQLPAFLFCNNLQKWSATFCIFIMQQTGEARGEKLMRLVIRKAISMILTAAIMLTGAGTVTILAAGR